MKFEYQKAGCVIVTSFKDGSSIEWIVKEWNRTVNMDGSIYDVFNSYLGILSASEILRLENIFQQAYNVLLSNENLLTTDTIIKEVVDEYFSILNWEKFEAFCYGDRRVNLSKANTVVLDPLYTVNQTYFADDHAKLIAFTIFVKGLLPIFGMYSAKFKLVLGDKVNFYTHTLNLFPDNMFTTNPAAVRLLAYINTTYESAVDKNLINVSGLSIITDVDVGSLVYYFLAHVIWKKLLVFNASGTSDVVTDVYHQTLQSAGGLAKNMPTNMALTDSNDVKQESTVADSILKFKVCQKYPPAMAVLYEEEFVNYNRAMNDIDESTKAHNMGGYVSKYHQLFKVDNILKMGEIQQSIVSVIVNSIVYCTLLDDLGMDNQMDAAVIAVSLLDFWGLKTIVSLFVVESTPKDSQIFYPNAVVNKIPAEMIDELNSNYSHVTQNPALLLIDDIVKKVLTRRWDYDLQDVRIELAKMILISLNLNHLGDE